MLIFDRRSPWLIYAVLALCVLLIPLSIWSHFQAEKSCRLRGGSYQVIGYYQYWVSTGNGGGYMATGATYGCVNAKEPG